MSSVIDIYGDLNNEFKLFLDDESNSKIIFTSKYGFGKTTFLNQFFKSNTSDYYKIHLYPVNYSVSDNKDIFSLIKYDILFSLIDDKKFNNDLIDKLDQKGFFKALPKLIGDNWELILLPVLLYCNPTVGLSVFDKTSKIIDKIRNVVKDVKKSKEASTKIDELTLSLINNEGNPYEQNLTTQIIKKTLELISIDENTKSVLLIDDLDRLDPAHLFRILNIFSAHSDYSKDKQKYFGINKFGFDKIIFVLDVQNLENIFYHFYGPKTDFRGYINKFYSRELFKFDTQKNISGIVSKVLNSATYLYSDIGRTKFSIQTKEFMTDMIEIVQSLVLSRFMSIRELIKFYQTDLIFEIKSYTTPILNTVWNYEDNGICMIMILNRFFGNSDQLQKIMSKYVNRTDFNKDIMLHHLRLYGLVASFEKHWFANKQITVEMENKVLHTIVYKRIRAGDNRFYSSIIVQEYSQIGEEYSFEQLLLEGMDNVKRMGFI